MYIYVLMFNVDGQPSKPFYVGQAKSPANRFHNHQMIMWHWGKYARPVTVWIAGWVREDLADTAEMDLIRRLTGAGYRLTNMVADSRSIRHRQQSCRLMDLSTAAIAVYLNQPHRRGSVLRAWETRWNLDTNPANLTRAEVIAYVLAQAYPTRAAKTISAAIAEAYDPELRYAEVNLQHVKITEKDEAGVMVSRNLKRRDMRPVQGVWRFGHNAHRGMQRFWLTRKHEAGVIEYLKTVRRSPAPTQPGLPWLASPVGGPTAEEPCPPAGRPCARAENLSRVPEYLT